MRAMVGERPAETGKCPRPKRGEIWRTAVGTAETSGLAEAGVSGSADLPQTMLVVVLQSDRVEGSRGRYSVPLMPRELCAAPTQSQVVIQPAGWNGLEAEQVALALEGRAVLPECFREKVGRVKESQLQDMCITLLQGLEASCIEQ